MNADRTLKSLLLAIAVFLGMIALRPYFKTDLQVSADSGRFDYVHIISVGYLYHGDQGILVLDWRNGNVWFMGRGNGTTPSYRKPVFVVRLPLDKLDQAPAQ